jgi:hypothetical protein
LDLPNVSASSAPIADIRQPDLLMYAGQIVDDRGRWHRIGGIRSLLAESTDHIIYDPHSAIVDWVPRPKLPIPITDAVAALMDGVIYITGVPANGLPSVMMNLDLNAAPMSPISPTPSTKWNVMTVPNDARDGRAILVATPIGLLSFSDGNNGKRTTLTSQVWRYDLSSSTWALCHIGTPEAFVDVSYAAMVDTFLMIIGSSCSAADKSPMNHCWLLDMMKVMLPGRSYSNDDWIRWKMPSELTSRTRMSVAVF